jgi:hypothetical protein
VQEWRVYFGAPKEGQHVLDFGAYDVGAAFVFFVTERYGEDKLRALLVDLGRTRSLDASSRAVLGAGLEETQGAWEQFLARTTVRVPAIVERVPADGVTGVDLDLREAHVTFDVDMAAGCSNMRTPSCADGICAEHARWKDGRTLAIDIDRRLPEAHAFEIELGTHGCLLRSTEGVELPKTKWRFVTR